MQQKKLSDPRLVKKLLEINKEGTDVFYITQDLDSHPQSNAYCGTFNFAQPQPDFRTSENFTETFDRNNR